MNITKRTVGAVALAAVAAVGYGDDVAVAGDVGREVDGTGEMSQGALDLSEAWTVACCDPIGVPYSAVGWGIEENEIDGWTVTLELIPAAGGSSSVLASGLAGRGTNIWDTGSVRNGAYVLRHYVRNGATEEPIETLEAHFIFDSLAPLKTFAGVAEAVFPGVGRPCADAGMGGASWTAVGFAGDGVAGPATGAAMLTFALDGIGSFAFEYRCAAGETLTVAVDGGAGQTLAVAADWTTARFAFGVACAHTVVISAAGGGTAVRGVRWDTGRSSDGAVARHALDLSEVWNRRIVNDEQIQWSSLGWERVAEPESDKTVTLQLAPLSEGNSQTLASGLKGQRQTYIWSPGEVTRQVYNIKHIVVGGSPIETELNAYFSFVNYDSEAPSAVDVHAAVKSDDGTGLKYGIANDAENWWTLTGGPGEGIAAPKRESCFKIIVEGSGHLRFDYALIGGMWTVRVDGVYVRTMEGATNWMGADIPTDGALLMHVIEFVTELSSGDSAALKNVRWVDADDRFGVGQDSNGVVDLREGVLVVRRPNDLMPFAWSSTNFTGVVEIGPSETQKIDPQSVASVRVVQVTGAGDDISQWATEVLGTETTLVAEQSGEGTVKWKHVKPAVWKADFVIRTNDNEIYRETRILDLRKYSGQGLVLFVM